MFPNLSTGQLTAVVDENPQATFSSFKLHLNGGPKGTLTSPPTCGPNTTNTALTPWSGTGGRDSDQHLHADLGPAGRRLPGDARRA